ncbi:antitoxin YefM [Gammaproteobacteria bacterium]
MNTLSITSFRENLYDIAKQTISSHEPTTITSKTGSLVLLNQEDFATLMETIQLQSIPNLSKDAKILKKAEKKDLVTRDKLPW